MKKRLLVISLVALILAGAITHDASAMTLGYKRDKTWIPYCKVIGYEGDTNKIGTWYAYLKIVKNTKNYWQVRYQNGVHDLVFDIHKTMDVYRYYDKKINANGDVMLRPSDWIKYTDWSHIHPAREVVQFLRSGKIVVHDDREATLKARKQEAEKAAQQEAERAEAQRIAEERRAQKAVETEELKQLLITLKTHAIECFEICLSKEKSFKRVDAAKFLDTLRSHNETCNCKECMYALRRYCKNYFMYKVDYRNCLEYASDSYNTTIDKLNAAARCHFD